jgi:hypothetical protein
MARQTFVFLRQQGFLPILAGGGVISKNRIFGFPERGGTGVGTAAFRGFSL